MARRKSSAKKNAPTRDLEDLLVSGLRLEPGALCITGLANCCDKIFHPRTAPRSNNVLRAAMQFLARDRTVEEQTAMRGSRLFQCRCDLKDSFIASLHEPVSNVDALNFTILELAFAIMDALSPRPKDAPIPDESGKDLDQIVLGMTDWNELLEVEDQLGPLPSDWVLPEELQAKVAASEPQKRGPKEAPWPSDSEDVLPSTRPMAQTLHNLLLWTGEPCGGSGIFLLVSCLSDYSPSFAAEIPASHMALPCALLHLEQALDRFEAKAPPNTFRLAIAAVTHFLHKMPKERFVLLLTTFRDLLVDSAARIQPALAEIPGAEAVFAKAWWASVQQSIDAGPEFPWEKYDRPKPPRPGPVDDPAQIFHSIHAHRARSRCNKPDCPNRSEPPKTMMFCRRCALACYCTEACQKQAWTKGLAPHKPLCNAVDELRRAMDLQTDVQWKAVLNGTEGNTEPEVAFVEICKTKTVDSSLLESIAGRLAYHDMAMDAMDPCK
ncbi:hypothetical protein B0H16DRAFT_1891405 [Mycena metata]|uniref:MYND-type domain-containing protein n=1 Tax=Mycena metata TaxID=1033252 RepID=A0AAD7IA30_9AGAR|nr:hypothetical protein B0H16DRAFT_1891405 [Mycena metata]